MNVIPTIGAIVVATFRQMRRDRSTIVFLVLLPVGLMVLVGNIYTAEDNNVPRLAVFLPEGHVEGTLVVEALEAGGGADIVRASSLGDLDDRVRRRSVNAGLTVAGSTIELVGAPDVQLPSGIRFVVQGAVDRVDRAIALAPSTTEIDPTAVRAALAALPDQVVIPADDGTEARTQAAIGVLVLVTFMNLLSYASLVPSHRAVGVFDRLAVAPTSRLAVLAGYAVTFTVVAAVQMASSLLSGRVFVGIEWGPTAQVVGVGVAVAIAAGGLASIAATLLPSPESGSSIGGPVGFALGMLGGCLWPLEFVGGTLETIGRYVPLNWAVEALRDISAGRASISTLAAPTLGLTAVGIVCSLLGARRLATSWR